MNASDIQHEKHYAVRLGVRSATARVDAIDGEHIYCWICEDGEYQTLQEHHFRFECPPPDVSAAIRAKEQAERDRRRMEREERDKRLAKNAPTRGWPEQREAIIHRQGSVFCSGDYGITRE
ncbi:hypothetical protein [Petrachloros mirabilis]